MNALMYIKDKDNIGLEKHLNNMVKAIKDRVMFNEYLNARVKNSLTTIKKGDVYGNYSF